MANLALDRPIVVAVPVLSADSRSLAGKARTLDAAGVDWAHAEVMEDHFAPIGGVAFAMMANPGFGGRSFPPETPPEIRRLWRLWARRRFDPAIEGGGSQNRASAGQAIAAISAIGMAHPPTDRGARS